MTTNHAAAPDAAAVERRPRADVMAEAAGRIRKLDIRNTWQLAAGAMLAPLGVVVILISWYGAAHTAYVQQQIPYLVSGSFVGLGLMVVGALLFWAHWLYRIYDQADLHHAEQLAQQEQLFEQFVDAVLSGAEPRGGAARAGRPPSPAPAGADAGDHLVVTAAGTNVHRPDCPIVARHPSGLRRISLDDAAGRRPCRICQPGVDDEA